VDSREIGSLDKPKAGTYQLLVIGFDVFGQLQDDGRETGSQVDTFRATRLDSVTYFVLRPEPWLRPRVTRTTSGLAPPNSWRTFRRKLLAYHNLATLVKTNQMKNCLAEINADRV
jgi:hypothetical protein